MENTDSKQKERDLKKARKDAARAAKVSAL